MFIIRCINDPKVLVFSSVPFLIVETAGAIFLTWFIMGTHSPCETVLYPVGLKAGSRTDIDVLRSVLVAKDMQVDTGSMSERQLRILGQIGEVVYRQGNLRGVGVSVQKSHQW